MSKKIKSSYCQSGFKLVIQVLDDDFRKIETFKCNAKDFPKICQILDRRFGIKYKILIEPKDLRWIE